MSTVNTVRRGRSATARRGPAAARALAMLGIVALVLAGCAGRPSGPPFLRAPEPPEHRGRIYVYRSDEGRGLANVSVELDGRPLATLGRTEYETVEVASGPHVVRVGVRSAFWPAWGWNEQRVQLDPGETLYLALVVRLGAPVEPTTSSVEIAGRGQSLASQNVFIEFVPETDALAALATRTRATP